MVFVIYGTIGEYIKLLPLLEELGPKRHIAINVNMQPKQMTELFRETNVPRPAISVLNGFRGNDINTLPRMFYWILGFIFHLFRLRKQVRAQVKKEGSIFIVHGDTIIAPLAAFFAKYIYRLPVGHIEAGYRSGNWREPFPEEIDRVLADKLATINYAVGEDTIKHLCAPQTKGEIVDTIQNTIVDALFLAQKTKNKHVPSLAGPLPSKYILVSIHRGEIITNAAKMRELVVALAETDPKKSIVWLDHAPTQAKITQYGLDDVLGATHITRIPKLPYFQFVSVVTGSDAIITDSGGLQEEAHLLGIPCLIHRTFGEAQKAHMGTLSKLKKKAVVDFIHQYKKYKRAPQKHTNSPVKIIIRDLEKRGFIQPTQA